jgi:acyltransferase
MMLVIYAHFLEPIYPARPDLGHAFSSAGFAQWRVIYSFHMMLFYVVSGAVNRNLPSKPWYDALRASLRLLMLAWIVHVLGALTGLIVGVRPDMTESPGGALRGLFLPILEGYFWSIGVLWFLSSLACVQLLGYFTLRRMPALAAVALGMAGTAVTVYFSAPNQFMLRTWMPGLSFFALGFAFAQWKVRWPWWACLPLLAAAFWLAPLNHGCSFGFLERCDADTFGVRMFAGRYGYLPLFFASSLIGSLAVICASAGLSRTRFAAFLAHIGKHSLELFVINGFVATFLPPYIARMDWPVQHWVFFPAAAAAVIALHLAALKVLQPALSTLSRAAIRMAQIATQLFARDARRIS